jgi:hypothetical protein
MNPTVSPLAGFAIRKTFLYDWTRQPFLAA